MIAAAQAFDLTQLVRDYGDIEAEVQACREKAALFDFSFMSAARVSGSDALKVIARLTDRGLEDMEEGRIRYALGRGPDGWLRSDLTIWKEAVGQYLVMSGLKDDMDVLARAARAVGAAFVEDLSPNITVFAVQGPDSLAVLEDLVTGGGLKDLPYFGFGRFEVAGVSCLIGRLGYTGEPGFEIVFLEGSGPGLWDRLAGRARPGGFAAADCLRIEAGFVLFSNEFQLPVTAEEAGLGRFAAATQPPRYRLISFKAKSLESPVLWRPPENLASPKDDAIVVTSACHSVLAGGTLGLGYVTVKEPAIDRMLNDPGRCFANIKEVPRPFYDSYRTKKLK